MKLRSADWRTLLGWGAGVLLALLCMVWVLREESERQLAQAAQESALQWARFAGRSVPDLEAVFAAGTLTPAARQQLQRLWSPDNIFRFKLYDPSGRLVVVSDDLVNPAAGSPAALPSTGRDAAAHANGFDATLRAQVLAGTPHIALQRNTQALAGLPAVYSEAYVPVLQGGRVLGVVEVYVNQAALAATIKSGFARVAAAVAGVLSLLLAGAMWHFWRTLRRPQRSRAQALYNAQHDSLSGAMNRSSFNHALEQAVWRSAKGGGGFSLLCIDLDHFKDVNDSFGHAAGDRVLRVVTQRLQTVVREGDQVARLGGDEFALLLMDVATAEAVTPLAQRILQTLAQPIELGEQQVSCGASVGVAIHGVDAADPDELLGKADIALYRAKASGRATFSFYDQAMDRQSQSRRELARDLRDAMQRGQLFLHYQPLYGRDGRTLTGYEALLRWQHPTRGLVAPVEFIGLAEEMGLINDIGLWVLRHACRDAATWPDPLSVAVNLSAAQFASNDLVGKVAQALSDAGLGAHRLELEITESLLMHNTEQVMGTLRALSQMGVPIAMDDFGTGYSSLAYLWRFPFDKVKIDRAFTHNLGHDAKVGLIVHSIISMAHSLGIRVNAEGVETPSQMAALQERGCDELQGFLLGQPCPLSVLTHVGRVAPHNPASGQAALKDALYTELDLELPPTRPLPLA